MPDGRAFTAFLNDEFLRQIQPNIGIVGGYLKLQVGDDMLTIEDVLYRHVRCHLLHEAGVSPQLCFVGPATGFSLSYENGKVQLGYGAVEILIRIVRETPEHKADSLQPSLPT